MRVVFMGTPDFAVPSLRALASHHEVVAVYTRPDAASGRGRALRPTPVKNVALEMGLPVLQPTTLRDPDEQAALRALRPVLLVVAAYGLILPPEVLEIPANGAINVHASLLPRWRGAAPVQRAILSGDRTTGVSIMRMEEGLDTGPYCLTAEVGIGDKNTHALTAELASVGADLLVSALESIEAGTCRWLDQDEAAATYAPKVRKEELTLSPDLSVDEALRRIRASSDQAPARLVIADTPATVLDARRDTAPLPPGAVLCRRDSLILGLADGALDVVVLKPEGKKAMGGCDWARGARIGDAPSWSAVS